MENRNVGIINLQNVDNYGAVLLCLALQKQVEDLGYTVSVIDYRPDVIETRSILRRLADKVEKEGIRGAFAAIVKKYWGKNVSVSVSSDLKKKKFEEFRSAFLHRTEIYKSVDAIPYYDHFVVGSDVIWKPERVQSCESDAYFLKFADNFSCNKIAYAASIGTIDKKILFQIRDDFSEYVKRFDSISVREPLSVPYVQSMVSTKVFTCADPTLLQDCSFYSKLIDGRSETIHEKYIYFYGFDDDQQNYDYVNACSRKLHIPVICQCNNPRKINNLLFYSGDDGPAEFLYRIKNAEYIITNSFHGTIFSLLFHKNFAVLSRKGLDFRAETLLGRLGLKSRFVDCPEKGEVLGTIQNYQDIDQKIADWRDESIMFLTDALNRGGGGI